MVKHKESRGPLRLLNLGTRKGVYRNNLWYTYYRRAQHTQSKDQVNLTTTPTINGVATIEMNINQVLTCLKVEIEKLSLIITFNHVSSSNESH